MKHYYYADNDQELGPFTIEELKTKRLKKSTLVWADGMQDWAPAESISELNEILISEPPPLPKKHTVPQVIKGRQNKQPATPTTNTNFDLSYKKETEATVVGFLLLIVLAILKLTRTFSFETVESYNQALVFIAIGSIILRIVVTIWVTNIATRQNRDTTGWGFFAFFLPSIALIIIGLLNKLKVKIKLDPSLTTHDQVSILLEKANNYFLQGKYYECIEILNKALEIDNNNLDCVRLRALSNYRLKKFGNAKDDFKKLLNEKSFLSEAYYYLGNIAIQNHKRKKAINFWKKAIKHNNGKAQVQLDMYNTFTGEYFLENSQIVKKLAANSFIFFTACKYIEGLDEIDQYEKQKRLKTKIKGYENGIEIELRKPFKSYHIAIAFYEIDDIIYYETKKELELLLIDENLLRFDYNLSTDDNNYILKKLCLRYKEKTGKDPSVLSSW